MRLCCQIKWKQGIYLFIIIINSINSIRLFFNQSSANKQLSQGATQPRNNSAKKQLSQGTTYPRSNSAKEQFSQETTQPRNNSAKEQLSQ